MNTIMWMQVEQKGHWARRLLAPAAIGIALLAPVAAQAQEAALVVHLLDYVSVDYAGAVKDGQVAGADEFKEMTEFVSNIRAGVEKLPETPQKPSLESSAEALAKLVEAKAPPAEVAAAATALRQALIGAYGIAVGPRRAPDLARAATLYAEHCAGCHGATGLGDGPLAKGLDPAPANFHNAARQQQRSVHGLFNTLSLGVPGTSMRAFTELPDADRWALAYLAANWGPAGADVARGESLWKSGRLHAEFKSQSDIAGQSTREVTANLGEDGASVLAYLRHNPAALEQARPNPFAFTREKMAESLALYRQGDADRAVSTALTAYLEGFELVEASLSAVNADLMKRVERLMIGYRNALKTGVPVAQAQSLASEIDAALVDSEHALAGESLSPAASFLTSFVILFREGLEAVLVVAALFAFLRRSGQSHALPYLHGGWILALVAGALTWYVANRLVQVSGANREVTEGLAGLVAAAMLVYVGIWLHGKSNAQAWQGFLMEGAKAVKPGAAWGLALMAFLAVYREVFETVLFYEALWTQAPDQGHWILIGLAAAALSLAGVTWAMLRFSLRLPMGLFFGASGILLAVLAVILAGNGVRSLQEAGLLPVTPVNFVTIGWLGIHPSIQALGTQIVLTVVLVVLLRASSRKGAPAT